MLFRDNFRIFASMKQFLVVLLLGFSLASCDWINHDVEDPDLATLDTTEYSIESFEAIDFIRGEWLLTNGRFFVENHVSDQTEVTNHFIYSDTSSLNIHGTAYNFEEIICNKTKWTFYPKNTEIDQFWLNNDSIHPYWLTNFSDTIFNVNEYPVPVDFQQLGGSTRPIVLIWRGHDIMTVIVQEAEVNYEGWNVNYWSELTFRKVATW